MKPPWDTAATQSRGIAGPAVVALLALTCAGASAQAPAVRVTVTETTTDGATIYAYSVYNGTNRALTTLVIGYDTSTENHAQLVALPVGWTFDAGMPDSSATAPPGWVMRLVTTEESDSIFLSWSSDRGPQWNVKPGATATGFSVKLPRPSAAYRTARFMVLFDTGTAMAGSLEPGTARPEPQRDR